MSTTTTEWTKAEIESLMLLPKSTQAAVLESLTLEERESLMLALMPMEERESNAKRQAVKRAKARDIQIPPPTDMAARTKTLEHPVEFLEWFFPDVFTEPFTDSRLAQMSAIVNAACYGGDQAIADSRGEGKTTTAMHVGLYLMVKLLSTFPIIIGKSQKKSQAELEGIKGSLQGNERLVAAFPEIAIPFKEVGKWSSRARMQTLDGQGTSLLLKSDHLMFPSVSLDQLVRHNKGWAKLEQSHACGQIMAALGVDGPVRGTKVLNKRPTIAIIDDMEDREAANSDTLIEKNEEIIEQDIAGLGASSERIPRVLLCTIQNRKCIAYKYTDPKVKPSWRGKRYRKMLRKPDRMDLVEKYIELRQLRKPDDPDAREAYRFWRDNRDDIERGSQISNPHSYSKKLHADGEPLELSAVHAYFNRVADVGEKAVATEIDNDPPEESGPQGMGLTAEIVASRVSGLSRLQIPANAEHITAGIDIGKYNCHWTVCAWWRGAGGVVIDYGVAEVVGNENVRLDDRAADMEASEPAIYRALLAWRDYLLSAGYTDAAGERRKIDMVLCDSGTYTNAVYEFCRQVRGVFRPSKGIPNYKPRKESTAKCVAGANQHAQWLDASGVWLQELDTDYWKQWVHERFLTPTFDENNFLRRGSLSLYQPEGNRRHLSYAQHIVAEELTTEFKEGKGTKTAWVPRNPNNHWLDATYLAAACTEALGIQLIQPSEFPITPVLQSQQKAKQVSAPRKQHGQNRFRQRPGGWIQGMRKR